uniref:Uncharacterized protein n=1 Tax=Anopheles albimanus TaxID=7167 RepID=A0A182FYA7_ANOAL
MVCCMTPLDQILKGSLLAAGCCIHFTEFTLDVYLLCWSIYARKQESRKRTLEYECPRSQDLTTKEKSRTAQVTHRTTELIKRLTAVKI